MDAFSWKSKDIFVFCKKGHVAFFSENCRHIIQVYIFAPFKRLQMNGCIYLHQGGGYPIFVITTVEKSCDAPILRKNPEKSNLLQKSPRSFLCFFRKNKDFIKMA
jgi:hypothetical protein